MVCDTNQPISEMAHPNGFLVKDYLMKKAQDSNSKFGYYLAGG